MAAKANVTIQLIIKALRFNMICRIFRKDRGDAEEKAEVRLDKRVLANHSKLVDTPRAVSLSSRRNIYCQRTNIHI